ncbi:MAG: pilin [Patescibacteria group bacterium]
MKFVLPSVTGRKVVAALLVSVALLFSGVAVSAVAVPTLENLNSQLIDTGTGAGFNKPSGDEQIFTVIGQYILAINTIIGIVITCFFIYAGWLWITAEGNDEKVEQAKRIIRGSLIALVIVFAAAVITNFVLTGAISGDFRYGTTPAE